MKTKILSIVLIGIIAIATSSWTTVNIGGATHTSYSYDEPWINTFPHPCTGELVDFAGIVHISGHMTITPNGQVHLFHHEQLMDVNGIGQTTGLEYQDVGGFTQSFNGNVGETMTGNFHSEIVGNGYNASKHIHIHLTVNANGEVTAERESLSGVCRGNV
jgi:hypothetical protein